MKRVWNRLVSWLPTARRVRWHSLVMLGVLVAALGIRAADIRDSLPYPRHLDETTWANIALRMLQTGDLNPHRFRKPSLPVYLMLGGFSVGLVRAGIAGDVRSARELGTSATSYYLVPRAAEVPKNLFSLASVIALGLAGYLGYLMTRRAALLWLVPLVASVSASYYRFSWSYMNVDIIGAFFALCTIAYLVHGAVRRTAGEEKPSGIRCAVVAGMAAGLTVGSKYNLFPILVPCVAWFALFDWRGPRAFVVRCAVLGAASFVTFLVTTPYAVLDFLSFYSDVIKEVSHYRTGHAGATVEPGLPMLWAYLSHFFTNFGVVPWLLSLAGAVLLFVRDWRLALVLFSYPCVFVAYMCLQRVFFERNVVVVHLFIAMSLGVALLEGPGFVARAYCRRRPQAKESRVSAIVGLVAGFLVLVGAPWDRVAGAYSSALDPRNQAVDWLYSNVEHGTTVLVDERVEMDTRPLAKAYNLVATTLPADLERIQKLGEGNKHLVVISRESDRGKYSKPLRGDKARARFSRPADKLGGGDLGALTILERPERY